MSTTSTRLASTRVPGAAARSATGPPLSIVATSRNDNHGGQLLQRMQIFVSALLEQCERHGLEAELVLVEWNPPRDRPRFAEALDWTGAGGLCQVRIIEVPAAVHDRFAHADTLPLYQMLAKNVGIRRARGTFVLATNIDVLFSDGLCRFLAGRKLERGNLYRLDRFDVAPTVPLGVPVAEQLAFCKRNTIRRSGMFAIHDYTTGERHQVQERFPPFELFYHYVRQGSVRRAFRMLSTWQRRPRLHTNACGDFTLLSRDDWFALRGYAELDIFSWHLDSLFCYAAHFNGIHEVVLRGAKRLYHIEHATGSGWTVDGEAQLFARLRSAGIPWLSNTDLYTQADAMPGWDKPILYNGEDWGLVGESLPERVLC